LYCICNEKARKIADVWVGNELRVTFRRTFDERMLQMWGELLEIVEQISLSEDSDSLIWCYTKSGVYSTQSCYSIISYRSVTPMFIPAVWKIYVPPKIPMFLWLLSHNKLTTVDNLNKKGLDKPKLCQFYDEEESISHLFFECVVTRSVWSCVSEYLGFEIGNDLLSVASKWVCTEKHYLTNVILSAMMRGAWLIRNDFVFNKQAWSDVKIIWKRIWSLTSECSILCKDQKKEGMKSWLSSWNCRSGSL
jgi:hypothetical protein